MVVNSERQPGSVTMKRRVTADLFNFLTFPADDSALDSSTQPFRTRVKAFLTAHALLPPPSSLFPHLMTWQIGFRVGDEEEVRVCLDVVEEDVGRSRSIYCDQCRVVGWSGHPVCGKRYHFIIKADGNSIGGYHKPCTCCGDLLHLSESRCKTCNHVTTTDDVEDWVYNQLDNTTHLLHGVVHSNGYGHLLRVNGREGGSRILSGCSIMDFWDRLCKVLAVRKVSVMDVSKKYGQEYRLIHAITKGCSWYGNWDYEFGTGSFAVTRDAYKAAIELLAGIPLSLFLSRGQNQLHAIISLYQSLSKSKLVCVRDLFSFLTSLIHDAGKSSTRVDDVIYKRRKLFHVTSLRSWSDNQIERVEAAMLKVLRTVTETRWVNWCALRGVAYQLASPELLDYCLKDLEGKWVADGKIIRSRCNPDTGIFEYRLEQGIVTNGISSPNESSNFGRPSVQHILADLRYLYETLLHPQTMIDYAPKEMRDLAISSSQKLLDCKQFVKVYKPENLSTVSNQFTICVLCQLELVDQTEEDVTNPPPELIVLPSNATVSDLKLEASKAFQDVYLMFRRLQVKELLDFGGVDDSTPVKLLLGAADFVRVSGRCLSKSGLGQFRMERGVERWTVDCICGAKDDDGERMLACDICSVWQHTRCSGIRDSEFAPANFVCHKCRSSNQIAKPSRYCKDFVMSCNSSGGGNYRKEFSGLFNVR